MPSETFLRLPEEKRTRLVDAAWEEVLRVPFEEMFINKIILRARIPRGSFYQYFTDKKDLFFYLLGDMMRYLLGEYSQILRRQEGNPMEGLKPLLDQQALTALQDAVAGTYIHESVAAYIVSLIDATRNNDCILRGASPRATLSMVAMSKAVAQLRGRDYVTPRDVQEVFPRIIPHRLLLSAKAENSGMTADQILKTILAAVPAPKIR